MSIMLARQSSRVLTLLAVTAALLGCSAEPDRNTAAKLLEATEWPTDYVVFQFVGITRGFNSIHASNFPILEKLTQDGFLSKSDLTYQPGMPRYPGQLNLVEHQYSLWTPTDKAKQYIKVEENHTNLPQGFMGFLAAKGSLDNITGIAKVNDTTYAVEYQWKWTLTEVGEAIQATSRANPKWSKIEAGRAVMKKFDDGWRISKQ